MPEQANLWYQHPVQGWLLWKTVPASSAQVWKSYFDLVYAPTVLRGHLEARILPEGMVFNQQHARRSADGIMNDYLLYRSDGKKALEEANFGLWPLVVRSSPEWYLIRAHGLDQARNIVKAKLRSDGMGPGIIFSSKFPGTKQIKAEVVDILTRPGLVWVTSDPHKVDFAMGSIDRTAYIKVPVTASRNLIDSGVLASKAYESALKLANKRGVLIAYDPDIEVLGPCQYEDQYGKNRRGFCVVYWYLVTYPDVKELSKVYPTGSF